MPLDFSIERGLTQLDAINDDAQNIFTGLSSQELSWQPNPNAWSIGQCFSHLIVSNRVELPYLENAVRLGRERKLFGEEPFRYGFLGNRFVRSMDAPPKMRFRAPKVYRPSSERSVVQSLSGEFFELQDQLKRCCLAARGLHLSKVRVGTAVTRWLRLSLGQALALTLAHERRHLWQAHRVKERLKS
jgi:hypothetical protein